MPYEWSDMNTGAPVETGAPFYAHVDAGRPLVLTAWPYRSLKKKDFVRFMAATSALLFLPLLALLGQGPLWVMLPFLLGAIALIWFFINRSYRDGTLTEVLELTADTVHLTRREPKGAIREWQANPYWITVTLHRNKGPVPHYLTLRGDGAREVELGAFLTPEERVRLSEELQFILGRVKGT
ncbi:DUF2244 domain-containing protein [Rhodobacteraceae bacterium MYP1-1]|uniref:DUF2244 domain-containing protein n=2 Tax=Halocynthiibacter styelae TaxID=2761955 RepID=A0A8J7LP98_9RHOB|nr:DUF2244 domain-containing protein [Paenihalocynthiibacter styelae]